MCFGEQKKDNDKISVIFNVRLLKFTDYISKLLIFKNSWILFSI